MTPDFPEKKLSPLRQEFNLASNAVHDSFTSLVENLDRVREDFSDMAHEHKDHSEFLKVLEYAMNLVSSNDHISFYNKFKHEQTMTKTVWLETPAEQKRMIIRVLNDYADKLQRQETQLKLLHNKVKSVCPPSSGGGGKPKRTIHLIP